MSYRRVELAVGEWFHCYTRTIDHSRPFEEPENIRRFLETLYLANQAAPMPTMPEVYKKHSHNQIFLITKQRPLVAIGAYCIMPTHYHLLVQPVLENGLSEFMHKVGTGFTRFYNDRHCRVGNLFVKPFRSKHISSDGYFGRVANYIHLNPIELFDSKWKQGSFRKLNSVANSLLAYPYNSLIDYQGNHRPQRNILNEELVSAIQSCLPSLQSCIEDAAEYYQSLELGIIDAGDITTRKN